ncbi:MAG: type transport system permease protein [Actinomycetota bacterium]|nr:type transport system permease protein [Actinomycetota bacterium]
MRNLIRAELLKLRTTRMFWYSALAALAFVPISLAITILTAGQEGAGPALNTSEGIRNVMSAASSGTLIVLIIGILVMAGEFRHNTATSTFLVSPDRKRVVGAKLVSSALVGVGIALAASALTVAIAIPWQAIKNVDVSIFSADVGLMLLGAVVATALYALVGVGVGSLIRNQTAAIAIALVWVMIVEGLVVALLPEVGRWLPGGAVASITGAATADGGICRCGPGPACWPATDWRSPPPGAGS